jgi:hypothetical protein
MSIIKRNGNPERYHNQTSAQLIHVCDTQVAKLPEELLAYHGGTIPRGTCIVCTYKGNFGIPFIDIISYGSARLMRLEKSVGMCFELEDPAPKDIKDLPLFKEADSGQG